MYLKFISMIAATSLSCVAASAQWKPAGNHIRTPWAEKVSPENVHPEYPRPQMVRASWQSLNGLWDYAVTSSDAAEPLSPQGKILVPFAIESSLSGVGKRISPSEALWYETEFSVPKEWKGKRVALNFEAVDWKAEVYVNDILVGVHTGGYTPFSFDITPVLAKGVQTLKLKVTDGTDSTLQPRGKQILNPSGIWYTAVTGIWQSVWLEPLSDASISSYYAVSDVDASVIEVSVETRGVKEGDLIQVDVKEGGIGYSTESGKAGKSIASVKALAAGDVPFSFNIPEAKLWSPESPYLYAVDIAVLRNGKVIDSVKGYTSLRKSSIVKDDQGHLLLGLNNKSIFQFGPLDQGWWPDGLYTAPTDEAMKYDIEKTKEFGFNMIRKHIKVEPSRWYYYCDQLGMIVWQDMPSIADNQKNKWEVHKMGEGTDFPATEWAKANYYKEWGEIIAVRKNFQCIAVWVPFNEAWGQFDTEKVVAFTRSQDNTRLINAASGGNHYPCGDILDVHHYPHPNMLLWYPKEVNVLGEYGGIGLPLEGHLWQPDKNWGYVKYKSGDEVLKVYGDYAEQLIQLIGQGCSGAVYTQTTDVESEINGLMTYDRKVIKMPAEGLKAINQKVINSLK